MNIENFNLIKQTRNNTCGYATASMIVSYLENQVIDEADLIEKEPFDEKGITFFKLMDVYKKYLTRYRAEIVHGEHDKTIENIKSSLEEKIPLHILHLVSNIFGEGEPVLHYSAVIGYNEEENNFLIADPYGSMKTMKEEDFFTSISFRNECLPEIVKKIFPSNLMIKFIKI